MGVELRADLGVPPSEGGVSLRADSPKRGMRDRGGDLPTLSWLEHGENGGSRGVGVACVPVSEPIAGSDVGVDTA